MLCHRRLVLLHQSSTKQDSCAVAKGVCSMTIQEEASKSEGSLATIDGRDYFWRVEDATLRIRNSDGEELNSTSAEVLVALGGSEPEWLKPVEALTEAFK